jgi:hypothetical protein
MPGREFQPTSFLANMATVLDGYFFSAANKGEYGGDCTCTGFRAANFTFGIMAALKDVAVFGRRINVDDQGMTLTTTLLILI